MRLARSKQKAKRKAARDEREEKDGTFQIKDLKKKTKKDVAETSAKMAEEARLKHQVALIKSQHQLKKRLENIQVHAENANPMWKVNLAMPRKRANILLSYNAKTSDMVMREREVVRFILFALGETNLS